MGRWKAPGAPPGPKQPKRQAMLLSAKAKVPEDGSSLLLTVCGMEPIGLNKMLRMHWSLRKRQRDAIAFAIRSAGKLPSFKGKMRVVYYRTYRNVPLDFDNLAGSCKAVIDVLVTAGVLEGDAPKNISPEYIQAKRVDGKPYFEVFITRQEE